MRRWRQGIRGLGKAKIARLQAALELARRAALPDKREERVLKSTEQAANYFKHKLGGLPKEHFCIETITELASAEVSGDICALVDQDEWKLVRV